MSATKISINSIPQGWIETRLKDVATCNDEALSDSVFPEKEIRYVEISDVSEEEGITNVSSMVFGEAPSRARRITRKGDVVISTVRTYLRAVALVEEDDLIVSTGFAVLRPKSNVLSRYLHYLLLEDSLLSEVIKESTGVSYPAIQTGSLVSLPIILPPLDEQMRLANYLDKKIAAINATIAARNEELKLLKKFKQSKINEVVIEGLRSDSPMKNCEISWIGNIPEHWSVRRIKDIFYESAEVSTTGTEELLSVSEYYGVAPRKDKMNEDEEFETRADSLEGYKICRRGDLVSNIMLTWKRALGVSQYDGIVSPAYGVYRGINIDTRYYHYLFRSDMYIAEFKRNSTGIIDSRLRLYSDRFFAIKAICPPLEEQREIAEYLDSECDKIDMKCTLIEKQMEKLQLLKRALINEVVTGKRQLA